MEHVQVWFNKETGDVKVQTPKSSGDMEARMVIGGYTKVATEMLAESYRDTVERLHKAKLRIKHLEMDLREEQSTRYQRNRFGN